MSLQCLSVGCALFFHAWLSVVLLAFKAVSSLSRIVDHCFAAGARVDCNAHGKVLPLEWNPFFRPHLQIPRYLNNSAMHQRSQQSATDNAPQTSPSPLRSNSLSLPSHAAPRPSFCASLWRSLIHSHSSPHPAELLAPPHHPSCLWVPTGSVRQHIQADMLPTMLPVLNQSPAAEIFLSCEKDVL
jgi:hypothetical protein